MISVLENNLIFVPGLTGNPGSDPKHGALQECVCVFAHAPVCECAFMCLRGALAPSRFSRCS